MHILETQKNAANEEFYYILREELDSSDLKSKVAPWHVVHYEIEVHSILESVHHIHEKRML